jgi:hypothetical protein
MDAWGRYDKHAAQILSSEPELPAEPPPERPRPAHRPRPQRGSLTGDPTWDALLSPLSLAISAGISLVISLGLFCDLVTGRQLVFEGWLIIFGGLLAVCLGYYALAASLYQLTRGDLARRGIPVPRLGLVLGALALAVSLALPLVEPTVQASLVNDDQPTCRGNLLRVWTLVNRYHRETGSYPPLETDDYLRPVWERYRSTDARAFFCPESFEYRRILDSGGDFRQAAFEDISYDGGLFPPDTARLHMDSMGAPLLWEKRLWHGADTVNIFTTQLGAHACRVEVLRAQISRYREALAPTPTAVHTAR